jgi:adenosylcobyric acid synthase
MGRAFMVAGTGSNSGKTTLVAAMCRYFSRKGLAVAPFKAQNMSLNSFVTKGGEEIAVAQALQARAAGLEPDARMNPVLIKPTGEGSAELILMGRPQGLMGVSEYMPLVRSFFDEACSALESLLADFDLVIVEGAGSYIEPNLLEQDVANAPLAAEFSMPVVLVADVERGGAGAAVAGTEALARPSYSGNLKAFVINKFRGKRSLVEGLVKAIEETTGLECLGVVPHVPGPIGIAEDSLSNSDNLRALSRYRRDSILVACVAIPRMANATDLSPFAFEEEVGFVVSASGHVISRADVVVLPGSRLTVADLAFLREKGIDQAIEQALEDRATVVGICGGYQMLTCQIEDEVESRAGSVEALGLLPGRTRFYPEKRLARHRAATVREGVETEGYEIHRGVVEDGSAEPLFCLASGVAEGQRTDGVWGTMLHGAFEGDEFRAIVLAAAAERKRKPSPRVSPYRERADGLMDDFVGVLEASLDMDRILSL